MTEAFEIFVDFLKESKETHKQYPCDSLLLFDISSCKFVVWNLSTNMNKDNWAGRP